MSTFIDIPLHPAIVHLPIGLLFTSSLFAITSLFYKTETLKTVNIWLLPVGVFFSMIAIGTGLYEAENLVHNQQIHQILQQHEMNAFITSGLYISLLVWKVFRSGIKSKPEYFSWVFVSTIALLFLIWQGHLGGRLVFEQGAGVEPMKKILNQENHSH